MSDEAVHEDNARVGFRDIYRAVGESETRIKEHISLVLLPITATVADHETRLRNIETLGSDEAREAASEVVALGARVTIVETWKGSLEAAGIERRRLGDLSTRTLASIVLVSNFVMGIVIAIANVVTGPK